MQKIIAIILVVCLLAGLTTSASAVDVYATIPETQPLLKSSSLMSTYDSGISTTAVEPDDLGEYLSYNSLTVAKWLQLIAYAITGNQYGTYYGNSIASMLQSMVEGIADLENIISYSNTYLSSNGNESLANTNNIGSYLRNGFLGLSNNIKTVGSNLQGELIDIYNRLDSVVSGLTTVNTSVNTVNTSVGTVNTSVNAVNSTLTSLLNYNFIGAGINLLGANGSVQSLTYNAGTDEVLRLGFVGLRSVLTGGVDKSFSYFSTLYDNNNTTTTTQSVGIAPLLNTHLSNIGENLAHLAYVFANDEEIKLREDSQPLLDTTDSFYDDSDSNVKVSINNVGSLKDIAGNFTSIIDADADIGDAFSIVSNSNTYRWFSADTAMNLDSLGVAPADFEESTYDRLHREFNEIYFPDRVGGGN